MLRQYTLRLSAFLLLATLSSSASACGLLPILNPFAWVFGYGCGYGYGHCGYGYAGYSGHSCRPWCGHGCGYGHGYYRGGHHGGYPGWGGSVYTPAYPSSTDCNCGAGTSVPTPTAPATTGVLWPNSTATAQLNTFGSNRSWRPQYQWSPSAPAWRPQPFGTAAPGYAAPQTAMSTAPMYGPVYEVPGPVTQPSPQVAAGAAGDIQGDHHLPVIPNGYYPGASAPIHPASFQPPRPRPVRRYSQVVQ